LIESTADPAVVQAGTTQEPFVELRHVSKRFGQHLAIDNASLSLSSGCFITLLGPSGCGKTTLLRMIGGLEQPDEGDIVIGGRLASSYCAAERPTRMVFQSYALFPHMTVARNVGYGLRMRGLGTRDVASRVAQQLELVGLSDKASRYPSELSGGQQQRVALARALVTKPAILLLDEPLAALDLKLRQRMQAELKSLQRAAGITFIYVTHDQHEALALSDEVVVMQSGRIVQRGTPTEIYRRPVNRFVADFVGEATMIAGRVKEVDGSTARIQTQLGELKTTALVTTVVPGTEVVAVIRPEDVMLGRGNCNSFSGRVRGSMYRGMDLLADIESGNTLLRMSVPGTQDSSVATGAAIEIHIRDATLWLVAADNYERE
jgi:ABC-type Fe3+/spermidine/putrescine transport system ATPase subunit